MVNYITRPYASLQVFGMARVLGTFRVAGEIVLNEGEIVTLASYRRQGFKVLWTVVTAAGLRHEIYSDSLQPVEAA